MNPLTRVNPEDYHTPVASGVFDLRNVWTCDSLTPFRTHELLKTVSNLDRDLIPAESIRKEMAQNHQSLAQNQRNPIFAAWIEQCGDNKEWCDIWKFCVVAATRTAYEKEKRNRIFQTSTIPAV